MITYDILLHFTDEPKLVDLTESIADSMPGESDIKVPKAKFLQLPCQYVPNIWKILFHTTNSP